MSELAPFIIDLAIILGIAGIALIICKYLKQPVVLGYLIAGLIAGPNTPPHFLISDPDSIKVIAELGVIFLMFSLGLEFSFHKLKRIGAPASITGIIEAFFVLVSGYGLGRLLGWDSIQSLFLGAALAISSTTIIIKTLHDLKLNKNHFAELIFGVLVIEDLLAILMLVGLSTFAVTTAGSAGSELFYGAVRLILTVSAWFIIGYFVIPSLFRTWLKDASDEILIVISVAFCLGLVSIAEYFHYSVALGAFIMGSILAETDASDRITHLVDPLKDIFAAVFFISIGMLINPVLIWHNLDIICIITLFTIVTKLLFSFLGAWLSGQRVGTALQVGFSMAQIGEFSFIIVGLGASLNLLNENFYPIIVAVSLITSFTTPYFIKFSTQWLAKRQHHKNLKQSLFAGKEPVRKQLKISKLNYFKNCTTRFFLNALIVAIIFICLEVLFFPYYTKHVDAPYILSVVIFLCTYVPAAPFIWGALNAGHINNTAPNKTSALVAYCVCTLLAIIEIYFLIDFYFIEALHRVIFITLVLLFSLVLHKPLEKIYSSLEEHLKGNLKQV